MIEFTATILVIEAPCGIALATTDENEWLTLDWSGVDSPGTPSDATSRIYSGFFDEANGAYGAITSCELTDGSFTFKRAPIHDCPAMHLKITLDLKPEEFAALKAQLVKIFVDAPERLTLGPK